MGQIETVGSKVGQISSVGSGKTKPAGLASVAAGFDIAAVRCAVEKRLEESIRQNKELVERIKALNEQRDRARVRGRLELMTDGYRVDEAITPKLARLGQLLAAALRLVHPLDIFVWPSNELNAYCLPSRKGNRLIMCLYSGLVSSLTSHELLFVMGHEVGHAILKHGETLGIGFDNPNFSPLEVVKLRALERAREVSCDRFGLSACQDVRVASTALFKIASGLNERWIVFDETAYSRHFDELSSISELVDLEDASRTHPLTPLRVKALIAYSKSETYARAFGKTSCLIPAAEMERGIETMLSVLDPDVAELDGKDEQEAANRFLFDGALLVISADGVVAPEEVAWLEARTSSKWSGEELSRDLSKPEFRQDLQQRLEANASVLRHKLSELGRANLLSIMCDIAVCAGGIPQSEFEVIDLLRQQLRISPELAQSVLNHAKASPRDESEEDSEPGPSLSAAGTPPADPLDAILLQSKLPDKALAEARTTCDQIRSGNMPLSVGVRTLVSWAICASRHSGSLTRAQGKKIAVAAVRVCRQIQDANGIARKACSNPMDDLVREYGVVALFNRNETVYVGQEDVPYVIVSISRTKDTIVIAPADNLEATIEIDPRELRKDPVRGDWPPELMEV